MLINAIDYRFRQMGAAPEGTVAMGEWIYFSPCVNFYHRLIGAEACLPRFAELWRIVRPRRYLVIGTLLGTTESWAIRQTGHHPELMVCCDVEHPGFNASRDNLSWAYRNITHPKSGGYTGELVMVRADSQTSSLPRRLAPYDLVYVDGDHDYAAALRDITTAAASVAPGGVVAIHDLDLTGVPTDYTVRRAFRDWLRANPGHAAAEIPDSHFQMGLGLVQF